MKMIAFLNRVAAGILAGCVVAGVAWADVPTASRTNVVLPKLAADLHAGPNDARIAHLVSLLLQRNHYSKREFDDRVSSEFLDEYINTLDPQHLLFLASDIAGIEGYRHKLDELTFMRGDTSPAYVIFDLFLHRMEQRAQYCVALLQTNHFTFTNDVKVSLNRKDAPFPKDLAAARQLWGERLMAEYLQEKLDKQKSDQIVETLTRRYQRILKTFAEWDSENVLEIYLNALAHVYDPHTDYMGKSALENFAISMNLALFGIGAELRSEDGICKINRVMPNSPAERSKKIKVGDRIVAVAQGDGSPVDIVDMPLNKAVNLIRGPKGSEVRLTIEPASTSGHSERRVVTLIRDEIKLEDQAAKAKLIELARPSGPPLRLGVIDLPSFYASMDLGTANGRGEPRSTSADVAKLLRKLEKEGAQGIILDLRRNGGGSLEEAIALTGLFVKKGPVVQVRDWDRHTTINECSDEKPVYDGPLIVLTSRFSASASEIVAAALQDYERALIVGDSSTHGKGTVQSLNSLKNFIRPEFLGTNDPGALKLTIRKFYRINGKSTQLNGVTPDLVLPSVNNVLEVGESSLDHPLPGDSIDNVPHEDLHRVAAYLDALRQRSAGRVAASKDFQYAREDMALARKVQAEKSISLNEAARLQEKKDADARAKARKTERASRPAPDEKVYDITLALADQPGLPAPETRTNSVATVKATAPGKDAATGTNTVADAKAGSDEEDATPVDDWTLQETEAILADYIGVSAPNGLAQAAPPPGNRKPDAGPAELSTTPHTP